MAKLMITDLFKITWNKGGTLLQRDEAFCKQKMGRGFSTENSVDPTSFVDFHPLGRPW